MANEPHYPALKAFLERLNKLPPNARKYMDINGIIMMSIVPIFIQIHRSSLEDPSGYAPGVLVIIGVGLAILSLIVEVMIAAYLFVGISWIINVPSFLAVGVIRGILGSIERYRISHVRFYSRYEGDLMIAVTASAIGLGTALWALKDYLLAGSLGNLPLIGVLPFIVPFTLSNLTVSWISKRKRRIWEKTSDRTIQDMAERKRERYPMIVEAPSLDEIETTKALAELGDDSEHEKALILDEAARNTLIGPVKTAFIVVIVLSCVILLFL